MNPLRPKWKAASFRTRGVNDEILRHGYVCEPFGIGRNWDNDKWTIYHLPSGTTFLYSVWPTYRESRSFADALLRVGDWMDSQLHLHPEAFTSKCHEVAAALGYPRREMEKIA